MIDFDQPQSILLYFLLRVLSSIGKTEVKPGLYILSINPGRLEKPLSAAGIGVSSPLTIGTIIVHLLSDSISKFF